MPVTEFNQQQETIYQRDQYVKGGIGIKGINLPWTLYPVRPAHRMLVDIGCGEGITLEKMHRLFPDRKVLGIDILLENIDICRRYGCKVEQVTCTICHCLRKV